MLRAGTVIKCFKTPNPLKIRGYAHCGEKHTKVRHGHGKDELQPSNLAYLSAQVHPPQQHPHRPRLHPVPRHPENDLVLANQLTDVKPSSWHSERGYKHLPGMQTVSRSVVHILVTLSTAYLHWLYNIKDSLYR